MQSHRRLHTSFGSSNRSRVTSVKPIYAPEHFPGVACTMHATCNDMHWKICCRGRSWALNWPHARACTKDCAKKRPFLPWKCLKKVKNASKYLSNEHARIGEEHADQQITWEWRIFRCMSTICLPCGCMGLQDPPFACRKLQAWTKPDSD